MASIDSEVTYVVTVNAELFSCKEDRRRIFVAPQIQPQLLRLHAIALRVFMVDTGHGNSAVVSEQGDVLVWGKNSHGQFGIGKEASEDFSPVALIPRIVFGCKHIIQVSLSMFHSLALSVDGTVYSAGRGHSGELGHGDTATKTTFTRVAALAVVNVVFVAAGTHCSAMLGDGGVFTCGTKQHGVLGLGDNLTEPDHLAEPTRIQAFGIAPTVFISMSRHTVAVQGDGSMYVWGENGFGQLGLGDLVNQGQPTVVPFQSVVTAACGNKHTLVLAKDRVVYSCGRGTIGPLPGGDASNGRVFARVEGIQPAVSVSAGYGMRSAAVTTSGRLYTWEPRYHVEEIATYIPEAPVLRLLYDRCARASRVGHYNHKLPEPFYVAFAMGTHTRLGKCSVIGILNDDSIRHVIRVWLSWPTGPAGAFLGHARLLGGGVFDSV